MTNPQPSLALSMPPTVHLMLATSWKQRARWVPVARTPDTLSAVRELARAPQALPFNPEVLHLPVDFAGHPVLAPLLGRWLKNLAQQNAQTRSFRDRSAAAQGSSETIASLSRQIAQVLDIEPIPVKIGPAEPCLYAEVGVTPQGSVLIFHPELEKRNRSEQRFIMMRAVFAHFQKHNVLIALTQNWNLNNREHLLSLFFTWNQRNARPILNQDWSPRALLESKSLARLSQWLNQLYQKYQSTALYDLREMLVRSLPFRRELDLEANLFATLACGQDTAKTMLPLIYGETAAANVSKLEERLQHMRKEAHSL